ncbi:MAG: hypothetical protein MI785_06680 [Kiloniellales bacterium]|nr:hypothetical protein [Kiloniellales bacterium]
MPPREAEILRELQNSILFAPGFPKRICYSQARWATLSEQEIEEWRRPQLEAIERAGNSWRRLESLVRRLADARYPPAIPTLAELWRGCALAPVRTSVGHALFAMHRDEARSILESMIEDSDPLSVFLGVRAVFDRDPARAYEHLEPYFMGARVESAAVAVKTLELLTPESGPQQSGCEIWSGAAPHASEWLKLDPRWLDLCAHLRHDGVFGEAARAVLRGADPDDCLAALNRAREMEPPQAITIKETREGDLLTRYRAGAFDEVWRELRSHQRIDGAYRDEVLEVAEETMKRVARNVDLVSERLRSEGWCALFGELRCFPSSDDLEVFRRIEAITEGPLPPSLSAFWMVVGGIDWVWDYQSDDYVPDLGVELSLDEMDPLSIDPANRVTYLFEEWELQKVQLDSDLVDPFRLDLSADDLHKMNVSGGASYGVELPFFGADPVFVNEPHGLPFVDYLRLCFRWAGFPGLEAHGEREDVQSFVRTFGQGLEPF